MNKRKKRTDNNLQNTSQKTKDWVRNTNLTKNHGWTQVLQKG